MNKYCKYTLEEDKSQNFSTVWFHLYMIQKHLKKAILCLNLKLNTELNLGGADRKFQKKFIFS